MGGARRKKDTGGRGGDRNRERERKRERRERKRRGVGVGGTENSSWTHSTSSCLKIAGSWTVLLCCSRWTLCGSIGR